MRDIKELQIHDHRADPYLEPPPTRALIEELERSFALRLPKEYVEFLNQSNGGAPTVGDFIPKDSTPDDIWSINRFLSLTSAREESSGLWACIEEMRILVGAHALPFGRDGGGNYVYFDLRTKPPPIYLHIHDSDTNVLVADTFEAFLDSLYVDPELR
jgi:hypothetical protein